MNRGSYTYYCHNHIEMEPLWCEEAPQHSQSSMRWQHKKNAMNKKNGNFNPFRKYEASNWELEDQKCLVVRGCFKSFYVSHLLCSCVIRTCKYAFLESLQNDKIWGKLVEEMKKQHVNGKCVVCCTLAACRAYVCC